MFVTPLAWICLVEMVIDQLTARGVMDASALYDPPFSSLYAGVPDELFIGKENVIKGTFQKLKAVNSELIARVACRQMQLRIGER